VAGKTPNPAETGGARPARGIRRQVGSLLNMRKGQVVAVAVAWTITAAGCTQAVRERGPAVFFPPAPALPRIQYLTRLGGRRDIEEQSSFNRFVVGERPDTHLDKPYGVAMHGGRIYVCDTNGTVMVFDLEAKSYAALEGATGPGLLRQPLNISITADGTKYVSDPVRGQVVAYDRDERFVTAYGTPGGWKPVDAVAFEGRLYVADMQNSRVVVLDLATGAVVSTIGESGEPTDRLGRPSNLAFDQDGNLYVTDVARFQVVRFGRDGRLQKTYGSVGDGPGRFARPKGIAVDRNGLLYAVDAAFSNVQIFTPEGRVATFFGGPGTGPGNLVLPAKVAIHYEGVSHFRDLVEPGFTAEYLVLVTSQFGSPSVHVFVYGHEEGKQYPTNEELLRRIEEQARPAEPDKAR
jgi:YVTN family beta-propeller protein